MHCCFRSTRFVSIVPRWFAKCNFACTHLVKWRTGVRAMSTVEFPSTSCSRAENRCFPIPTQCVQCPLTGQRCSEHIYQTPLRTPFELRSIPSMVSQSVRSRVRHHLPTSPPPTNLGFNDVDRHFCLMKIDGLYAQIINHDRRTMTNWLDKKWMKANHIGVAECTQGTRQRQLNEYKIPFICQTDNQNGR